MQKKAYVSFFFVVLGLTFNAQAQDGGVDVTLSTPALGSDMWTGAMGRRGLFVPRRTSSDCVTGEAHIAVDNNGLGYCIETAERTAATWEDARHACLQDGKRLPEPAEFKYACKYGAGLTGMTGNWEWATNFSLHIYAADSPSNHYLALTMGQLGCAHLAAGRVAREPSSGGDETKPYRCVR